MKKTLFSILLLSCTMAGAAERDSLLDEVVVTNAKENLPLRQQALSSTSIGAQTIKNRGIESVKDISSLVPGLYIPNYGSRLTTSVYLRGIGSRINTPSVGMYVDGLPWVDKSAFDFNIADVQSIEVLRGPQSTLYGRNTMGGLIRINTKNPLQYQGTDLMVGAATYNQYRASATHYHRISDRLGFSGGVSYGHEGGFFTNEYTGKKMDHDDDLSTRFRLVARPSDRVRLDFQANYEYSHQGAYPYKLLSIPTSDAFSSQLESQIGHISMNRSSKYDRNLLNLGLTAEHTWNKIILSNVLGFQYLKDDMHMDQDFTSVDIYTLRQRQNSRVLSEEIAVKNRPGAWRHWEMSTGVSMFYQWLSTTAPVTFQSDGISWLNSLINRSANAYMPQVVSGPMTMDFVFSDQIQGTELPFNGKYKTPTVNSAIYHQSTVKDLFGLRGFNATLGLRLDYEKMRLDYNSWYDFEHVYGLSGHLTMPSMSRDVTMVPEASYQVSNGLAGKLHHDYLHLLPKFSLQYNFKQGNVYGTISRGFRSGGYNIQMFSEVLQSMMRTDIMTNVRDATVPVLEAQPMVPADTKTQVTNILNRMATSTPVDVSALTLYKPEYAWNYEVGTHLNFFENRLQADASFYFTRITDQQLSQMSSTGLGRVTVNAGRSRSMGGEIALTGRVTDALTLHVNYGYTHATFRNYQTSDTTNLRGNFVPFVPRHTLDLGGQYRWDTRSWLQHITFSANWHAQGRIYWTEENNAHQNFYGTLDSRLTLTHNGLDLSLWGTNLTQQHYQAFYFESMSRSFAQKGRPLQIGIEVRLHI